MTLYYDDNRGTDRFSLQDFEPSFGMKMSNAVREAWLESYGPVLTDFVGARQRGQGPKLSSQEASERISATGLKLDLTPKDNEYTAEQLDFLLERQRELTMIRDVRERTPWDLGSPVRGVAMFGAAIFDPLNLATAFVPWSKAIPAAQGLRAMALSSSAVTRTAGRAGFGAVDAGISTAVLEPFYYGMRQSLGDDYTAVDSMANIAFGTAFGGGVHTIGGGGLDLFRARTGREQPFEKYRGMSVDDIRMVEGLKREIDAGMDARDVQRVLDTYTPEMRRAAGFPDADDSLPAVIPPAGMVSGGPARVKIGDDYEPAEWAVVDADQLSATVDKADNQFRDRNRAAYQAEIQARANTLDPAQVLSTDNPLMDVGPPTVAVDGTIIGGNGRTLFIQRAYEIGKGAEYREALIARLEALGIDPASVADMKKPVLVRRLTREVDVKRAAMLSNEGGSSVMSPLEQAKVDAERLQGLRLEADADGNLDTAANRAAIRRWVEQQPEGQRNALMTEDGLLSSSGLARLRNAVLFQAYGDSPTLARLIEATDVGSRNVAAALARTAGRVAEAEAAIARGELHDQSLAADIRAAVEQFDNLRRQGTKVEDYLAQVDAFGDPLSDEARLLLSALGRNVASARRMADIISGYYDRLQEAGNPGQGDMFGAAVPERLAMLDAAIRDAEGSVDTAAEISAMISPDTREATLRTGVAQGAEGRVIDVDAVVNTDEAVGATTGMEEIADAAARNRRPESVRAADFEASAAVEERNATAPKWQALTDAERAASEADAILRDTVQAGDQAFKYARGKPVEPRTLVAMHNLSEEGLAFSAQLGGLAVPSLGITKVDSPYIGFGGISLIAPKAMVDPQTGTPVFDRDAWTARFPEMNYKKPRMGKVRAFYDRMKPAGEVGADGDQFRTMLWEETANTAKPTPGKVQQLFSRYLAPRIYFAREVLGDKMALPMQDVPLTTPAARDKAFVAYYQKNKRAIDYADGVTEAEHQAAMDGLRTETLAAIDRYAEAKATGEVGKDRLVAVFKDSVLDDSGAISARFLQMVEQDMRNVGKKRVNETKLRERLDKLVKDTDPRYQAWVREQMQGLFEPPTIALRGKQVEPTLSNIVEAMTLGGTAGVEKSMTFSAGKVGAFLGKRFKSLDEIRAAQDQIVARIDNGAANKTVDMLLDKYRNHLAKFYTVKDWRGNIDTWASFDASMEALARSGAGASEGAIVRQLNKLGFRNVDQQAVELAGQAIDAIRNLATDYFEAKPQRAVGLNEFRGAVIPKTASAEARRILAENGVEVLEFNPKTEGARDAAIQKLAKKLDKQHGDILFSRGVRGSDAVYAIEDALRASFGDDTARLMEAGRIVLVPSTDRLPGGPHPADVKAATAPDGRVYVVAENVSLAEVRGLVLHEVGVHVGMERMLGANLFADVLKQLDDAVMRGDEWAVRARSAVPADTPLAHVREEQLAYLVQNAPDLPIVKRIIAAVRAWAYRNFEFARENLTLTEADYVAMAVSALQEAARRDAPAGQGAPSLAFSRGRAGLLPSPSTLTMPEVPTAADMQAYGRIETVPLSKAVSFQVARNWDSFNQGAHPGALVEGYGDRPLALKLRTGEYVIYDGNHRTDLALESGRSSIEMHVIDVQDYDPQHAGRKPAAESISDDDLLAELGYKYARGETPDPKPEADAELKRYDDAVKRVKSYAKVLRSAADKLDNDAQATAAMREAMPDITAQEIDDLLAGLRQQVKGLRGMARNARTMVGAEDQAGMLQSDAMRAADMLANNLEMAAVIEKRNAALNINARLKATSFVNQFRAKGLDFEGFAALLVGSERVRVGSRVSIDGEYKGFRGEWVGGMLADVENLGLMRELISGAFDRDIYDALYRMGSEKPDMAGLPKQAVQLAEVINKYQTDARNTRNRFGAWIRDLQGYITRQSHDTFKIRDVSDADWIAFVKDRIDLPKMVRLGLINEADPIASLRSLYDDFAAGVHMKAQAADDDIAALGRGSNLAKRESVSRAIYFKDGLAAYEYNERFGSGRLAESVLRGLDHAARSTSLLKTLGTNPEATLTRMIDEYEATLAAEPERRAKFRSQRGALMNMLAQVDGSVNMPGNVTAAKVGSFLRSWQNMARLGGAMISSFSDLAGYAAELRYSQDKNLLSGVADGIGALLRGRSKGERADIVSSLGVFHESILGGIAARFDSPDLVGGKMAAAQQAFFRFNGLAWWTEVLREGAALSHSHYMATQAGRAFDKIDPEFKRLLSLYNIDAGKWDLLRMGQLQQADGRMYLTPEGLKTVPRAAYENYIQQAGRTVNDATVQNLMDDLAQTLRVMTVDRAHHAVLEPNARTRAWMLRGTKPGTVPGELLRFIGQFKSFSVAIQQMVLGREVYGRGYDTLGEYLRKGHGDMLGLAYLIGLYGALGYAAMSLKDLLKGRTPRDPLDPKTMAAALAQGGGLGLYGDFLFGEYNRMGRTFTASVAGPVLGNLDTAADLFTRMRNGDDMAAASFKALIDNTPFLNLYWARPILDYMVLYQIQEALNPGFLRRMEKNIERQNSQTFLLPPSQVVR